MQRRKPGDPFVLRNGVHVPCVGYGTWQTPDGCTAVHSVKMAIACFGYRHVDTAAAYHNEASVGKGIRASGADRTDLFVTSKLWNTERGYEKTLAAFENTLRELGLAYLDLYLIHWPASPSRFENWQELNLGSWRAMTELYKAGKVRAIGVSNFLPHHLEPLMATELPPMVNQIEFHPGMTQNETVRYCQEREILVEAWSPLGCGRVLQNETLCALARKHGRTAAQVCIRWALQHNVLPLPKSITPSRIEENREVFDFALSEQEMDAIDALPPFGQSGLHPDRVDF